jgi:putative ABC transport system ATP-binding protein/lipoprotein-releasing system ATP-binding protein
VKKTFRGADSVTTVLRDVSVSIERGSFTAIVGPSGSGKSTLLTLVGALDRPDEGTIRVGDYDLVTADRSTLARYRRSEVGFVFQAYNLLRSLSAVENVEATLQFAGLSARGVRQRAMESLEQVGVADIAGKLPSQLSGGQQQRVAIARAIAHRPALVLADEPTGNLDRESGERVFGALVALRASHAMTCIVVTHDMELATRAERIVRMSDGTVLV